LHIFIKMKKSLTQKIEIPEGVEAHIVENKLTVKGKEGEISKGFEIGEIDFKIKDKTIILHHEKATKREKKTMNTIAAHIKNMIKGVQEKFTYKLKICFSHFPVTVDVKGDNATIKNFLGEKIPRIVKIPKGVEVNADKTQITITSVDKELAGQAAANFESSTKVKGRDRRVFQDGIHMIEKAGREI